MSLFLAYSPEYDLHLPGLSWLHPFDGRKYSHAWELLRQRFGAGLDAAHLIPQEEASRDDLLLAHTREYLDSLHRSRAIANALEIAAARVFPSSILDRSILRPMRLATQGSILAVERALQGHAVFNLGGGYHHAFADHGEGFCIYADAAVALMRARKNGLLHQDDDVLVLDLDAHRGNGTEDIFKDDPHVNFLDLYNFQIYPGYAETEGQSLVPIPSGSNGAFYLRALREELPAF